MTKGMYALTITMAVILGILMGFAIKMDVRSQDFINHELEIDPTQTESGGSTRPKQDFTIPDETTQPAETTRPSQSQGNTGRPGTSQTDPAVPPTEDGTLPSETEPPVPPSSSTPAPSGEEEDWETEEF